MGRKKKNASTEKDVEDFTVTKEDSLEVFSKKKHLSISKEVIALFDIKPVGKINKLSGHGVKGFNGKDYKDSLELAYNWMNDFNKYNDEKLIELVDYYPQEFMEKSVLVSYNIGAR